MENNSSQGNDGRGFRHSGQTFMILIIAAVITFFVYTMIRGFFVSDMAQEITYSDFVTMIEDDQVQEVEWGDNEITILLKQDAAQEESAAARSWWSACSSTMSP